jgi:hypothetical protein
MKVLASLALGALVALSAIAPASAASCSMSQAKMLATDYVKILETLPKTSKSYRFLGEDHQTKAIVGASVTIGSCSYSQVANISTTKPWCQYMPGGSQC